MGSGELVRGEHAGRQGRGFPWGPGGARSGGTESLDQMIVSVGSGHAAGCAEPSVSGPGVLSCPAPGFGLPTTANDRPPSHSTNRLATIRPTSPMSKCCPSVRNSLASFPIYPLCSVSADTHCNLVTTPRTRSWNSPPVRVWRFRALGSKLSRPPLRGVRSTRRRGSRWSRGTGVCASGPLSPGGRVRRGGPGLPTMPARTRLPETRGKHRWRALSHSAPAPVRPGGTG